MAIRGTLKRSDYAEKPWLAWNAFVYLIANENNEDFSPLQRIASLAFGYDSEVQNGGHLQYFENRGTARAHELAEALGALGAMQHKHIFLEALAGWNSKQRELIETVERYSQTALEGEFAGLDSAYSRCSPTIQQLLENLLATNFQEFIELQQDEVH
jgi:hypothetical protein